MPEEKKESFTFSDKIKNSKPAGSKSFAKSSSKVGRDGKPKQTIFERTRRDAPFFIAALVALLLLPFLYKYSGHSSSEDSTLLTPGSEEAMFDPERYGFDTTALEDPDNQVARLSGRSSFDLIRGFGNDEEDYSGRDDVDWNAYGEDSSASSSSEAEGRYDARRDSSTRIDEEENITNIYKRRARAGARAAFRRTPIGTLNSASMRRASGNRLGINPWGGSLKDAAKKVGASRPKDAPKPVSLQPLRTGGPARSMFGQGAAAAARKGLDNMGKANAREALHDAYVKPVDPTRTGGLDLFSTGALGGNGKLDRNINIAPGREPWWWDMMKTRMQKEWEERFNRHWNWIKFWDGLAQNILKGLVYCLITGDSGGDPDHFLGDVSVGGSSGKEPTCCGVVASKCAPPDEIEKAGGFEAWCKILKNQQALKAAGKDCGRGYKAGGSAGGASVGFFGQRLSCLGIKVGGHGYGDTALVNANGHDNACDTMPYFYRVVAKGKPAKDKWNLYTFVTARNYFPETLRKKASSVQYPADGTLLCSEAGNGLDFFGRTSSAMGQVTAKQAEYNVKKFDSTITQDIEAPNNTNAQTFRGDNKKEASWEHKGPLAKYEDVSRRNEKAFSCVIYLQPSGTFTFEALKKDMVTKIQDWAKKNDVVLTEEEAVQAFYELDLLSVESVVMKTPLADGHGESRHQLYDNLLPMVYYQFEDAYLLHKGNTNHNGGRHNKVYKSDWRPDDEIIYGDICYFDDLHLACLAEDRPQVQLKQSALKLEGTKWVEDTSKSLSPDKYVVTAMFHDLNAKPDEEGNIPGGQPVAVEVLPDQQTRHSLTYGVKKEALEALQKLQEESEEGLAGNIVWSVTSNHNGVPHVIKQTCPFGVVSVPPQEIPEIRTVCKPGETKKGDYPGKKGCPAKQECNEAGSWGPWEMTDPNNPACYDKPGEEIIVGFYREYPGFPCKDDIYDGARRKNSPVSDCETWRGCKLTVDEELLVSPDDITINYVQEAIKEFNRKTEPNFKFQEYTNEQLKEELTVANLVDAIRMHPSEDVPANVACVLGKTIGTTANDNLDDRYDNIFGAFVAFMGLDAASFPSKYTYDCNDGKSVIGNVRFPCNSVYWWGGYVDSNQPGKVGIGVRATEFKDADGHRIWQRFPLKGLLRGEFPTTGNKGELARPKGLKADQNAEEYYRNKFADTYKDLVTEVECNYSANVTLKKADVLAYIEALCEYGEEVKPVAWLKCNRETKKHKKVTTARKRTSVKKYRSNINRKVRKQKQQQRVKKKFGPYNQKRAKCC